MKKTCIVCEYGWIIIGEATKDYNSMRLGSTIKHLKNASVVRRWSNGRGIGGIAKAEYKDEYTLDYIGDVEIMANKVLFVILCEW